MEKLTQRNIIFDMKPYNGRTYRALCHFGYNPIISTNWWIELQTESERKKWIFFGPVVSNGWSKIYDCWLSSNPETMEQLKAKCEKLYDEHVLLPDRVIQKAMNL